MLKIDTNKKLTPVKFGASEDLSPGDDIIVIGNPFGLGTTVTSGILSAMNRDPVFSMFDLFLQTDAPINHGNSGGPIFNMKGKVIGVSTAYYTGGNAKGGSIGLGFAILRTGAEIIALLRKYGYLKLGWLGVEGHADARNGQRDRRQARGRRHRRRRDRGQPGGRPLQAGDITEVDGDKPRTCACCGAWSPARSARRSS